MAVLATDLRGHGEHPGQLDEGVIGDVEAAISFARRYGPVAVIGKSLGGRLALMSTADVVVAISPAIPTRVSPTGQTMFTQFPSPRVREPYPGYVVDLLKRLGPPPVRDRPTLLISATHDIQTIREGTRDFAMQLPSGEYREIEEELRPPVASGHPLVDYLPYWFNHAELLENTHVLRIVPEWVRGKLISRR
jgi:pimeloyl-ACP methyl ester carboxylesterase